MATDYEKYYQDNPHGLGDPTQEFVTFFNTYNAPSSKVLDVGCGQGRDALFIARLGHDVTAVDLSPTGIRDLISDANSEGLSITGVVADICDYTWQGEFDVIVIDRTLHMLAAADRISVLRKIISTTKSGTHILIADERSNIPAFKSVFEESPWAWSTTLAQKGFLFMLRE